jgi:hypothetical protein
LIFIAFEVNDTSQPKQTKILKNAFKRSNGNLDCEPFTLNRKTQERHLLRLIFTFRVWKRWKIKKMSVKTHYFYILEQRHVLTLKPGVFLRFHALIIKIKRWKQCFLRFFNEREWLTIAVPVWAFIKIFVCLGICHLIRVIDWSGRVNKQNNLTLVGYLITLNSSQGVRLESCSSHPSHSNDVRQPKICQLACSNWMTTCSIILALID